MNSYNIEAISVAVIACFLASAVYYMLFAKQRKALQLAPNPKAKRKDPRMFIMEIARNFVLALALAYLVNRLNITSLPDVLWMSLLLWLAFPFMLLAGSVMYEKFPGKLAAIHMGDWAIKLPLMLSIIAFWR